MTRREGLQREYKLRIRRVASFRQGVTVLPCSTLAGGMRRVYGFLFESPCVFLDSVDFGDG